MKSLTKQEIDEVLSMLDNGVNDSSFISSVLGFTKMQVAAVKAWRTMGKY